MKLRLRLPRELARRLRETARREPDRAGDYLLDHPEEWADLAKTVPGDAADILDILDEESAAELIGELDLEEAADILEEMRPGAAADLLEELEAPEVAALLQDMSPDDAADVFAALEPEVQGQVLGELGDEVADQLSELLSYPPDSAGGLMTTQVAALPVGLTAGEAIESLRRMHEELEYLSYVYVVDDQRRLVGVISFRDLVFARPGQGLDEVMIGDPAYVTPFTDREEVAEVIERYSLLALPVATDARVLLGMVTLDDVLEAVREEAGEDLAVSVGAGADETTDTPVATSYRMRQPWILVNLATAFLAAAVIGRFEPLLGTMPVLAAYMPIVASMGGNGGAQSLAVVIRGLALGDVPERRAGRVVRREVLLGFTNSLSVAVVAGLIAWSVSGQFRIGLVLGLAAVVNMTIAGLAGASIPIVLRRLGADPALASNILLTTFTDVVGFGGFLLIARLLV